MENDQVELEAEKFKEEGNKQLQAGHFNQAIEQYTKAINCKTPNNSHNAIYYSNRAFAKMKLGLYILFLYQYYFLNKKYI